MIEISTPFTRRNPHSHTRLDGWRAMPGIINQYTGEPYTRLERMFRRYWIGQWRIEIRGVQKGTRRIVYLSGSWIERQFNWRDRWTHIEVGGLAVNIKKHVAAQDR